jgi:hypothetical protein
MENIKKIELQEIQKVNEKVSKLSQADKDRLLASLLLTSDRLAYILKSVISNIDLSKKEKEKIREEIEEAISVGPSWLNYSYKIKKKKR